MSTPKRITFSLQLQANAVTCNGIAAPLRHHRAALFLDGLIAAHGQTRAYTRAEFLTAWTALDPLATPDRKAISRVVVAVREALGAVLPGGADRLLVPARGLTTGPWRLHMLAHEHWQVDALTPIAAQPEPCFTDALDPMAWHHAANELAMADAMLKEGHYADAAHLLQAQMRSLGLSDAAWCLWALRLVRVQRRLGQQAQGQQVLEQLAKRAMGLTWRMRAFVQGEVALLGARAAFNDAPLKTSLQMDFGKLRAEVDAAPNVALQWEWCTCGRCRAGGR